MTLSLETLRGDYREAILSLARMNHVSDVRVFGSVARGDAKKDSDIDLLVKSQPGCSLLKLCAMENAISDLLGGIKVDVLTEKTLRDEIAPVVLREAVML
jgi:predicted nucleotidyltransferase